MYASAIHLISHNAVRRDVIGCFFYPPLDDARGHDFDGSKIEGYATAGSQAVRYCVIG